MDLKFTSFPENDRFVKGTADEYTFSAKLYDAPSQFGINGGRVSKLCVWPTDKGPGSAILNYDRGWDLRPAPEAKSVLDEIVAFLEAAPQRPSAWYL